MKIYTYRWIYSIIILSFFLNLLFLRGVVPMVKVYYLKCKLGISTLSMTSFGLSADYKFGLQELSNAQIRIAKPYQFGVLLLQWNSLGNTNYNVNDWGLSLAKIYRLVLQWDFQFAINENK